MMRTPAITRRAVIGTTLALALGGTLPLAGRAQVATPAPAGASPTGEDAAVALLNDAAAAMTELDTFRFSILTTEGETTIFEGFTLEEIGGAVRRPSDFETTVTVAIPFATLDLRAVSVGGEVWIELPSLGEDTGGWTSLGRSDGLLSLLNPDFLILQAVRYLDDAALAGEDERGGEPVTLVTGTVNFRAIATELADGDPAVAEQIAEGPVAVEIAVDGENRIQEIVLAGPLLAAEADDVERTVTFSAFNEPVEITEPEIEGTPGT